MGKRSTRSSRQKDKLRKQQERLQVQESFQYKPVANDWKTEQTLKLNIPSHTSRSTIDCSSVPLTAPVLCRPISPDGNCFFSALSYELTGSENYHQQLRSAICEFMKTHAREISSVLPLSAKEDVNTYLHSSKMESSGTWGTEVEYLTASALLQTNIFVYAKHGVHWKWIKHSPSNSRPTNGIYLYHKNENHFDVVVSTQNSEKQSDLSHNELYNINQNILSKYKTDANVRKRQREHSKRKYNCDEKYRKQKKKYQQWKYKVDTNFRKRHLTVGKNRYKNDATFAEKKREYARLRYILHREHKKFSSVRKYCTNSQFRNTLKLLSKKRYVEDKFYRDKKIKTSKSRYATNVIYKEKLKIRSKSRYATNVDHREKLKAMSKSNYSTNVDHREKWISRSKTKYATNVDHREKLKTRSKSKYFTNVDHREKYKTRSKSKYSTNVDHREKAKKYSKWKYKRFDTFRQNVKASSIKKYANNSLFRHVLKCSLKKKYHSRSDIRQTKKQRVTTLRKNIVKSVRTFKLNISKTPKYVCIVCIRLLYRSQVKECKRKRYFVDGNLSEMAEKCLIDFSTHSCEESDCTENCWMSFAQSDKEWICHTCDRHLKQGSMPPQAQVNNLYLTTVPDDLHTLNVLERQLIALRIPFMKLLSLPRGGQKGVKGPVVNVPSDVTSVTTALPRNMNDAQLIKVKLKRKLAYKGHYKYKWINPVNVVNALTYLKNNNFWYENVTIDNTWRENIREEELVNEDDGNDSDSDEEPDDQAEKNSEMPVETCFQPVDMGQEILDTNKTLCIAPAESQSPQNIFQEKGSDAMAFPTLLPDGHFGLFEERDIKLTPAKYFNARLFSADNRFATNKEYIFFAQYVTEINYISSNISLALRKGKPTTDDGKAVTASMVLDSDNISDILKSDIGFRFLQPVRGTPPYWQRTMKDLYAMIHQLGIPTWFVTFSAAEMRWDDVIETLLYVNNDNRQVKDIESSERCSMITDNPVICARMFDHRVKCLFTDLLMSPSAPVGKVADYFYRTEFQQRGSPHIHALLWIEGAPKFNENTDKEVCNFIDKYVTCKMPDEEVDPELYNIISAVQIHSKSHSKSCKKYSTTCRFNFPRPPIKKTFIARAEPIEEEKTNSPPPASAAELDELLKKDKLKPKQVLKEIWLLLSAVDETKSNLSQILQIVGVTYKQFTECLEKIAKKNTVYLKRGLSDMWVNSYNEHLSRGWNANLDIQFVTDSYACVAYILSYISKAETEIGDLLANAQKEAEEGNTDAVSAMRKIGNAYLQNREVSAQEAVYRVCSLHLKDCSREVVFVPCGSNILKMSLPVSLIKSRSRQGGGDEENIWMTSVHEKYYSRPSLPEFTEMCMAEFVSKYRFLSNSQNAKSTTSSPVYCLQLERGRIKRRKNGKEAVVRFPKFNKTKNPEDYHLTLIQLYLPHTGQITLPNGVESFEAYLKNGFLNKKHISHIIEENRHNFEHDMESLEKAWEDMQEGRVQEESWASLAPEAEVERIEIETERPDDSIEYQEEIPELRLEDNLNKEKQRFSYEPPKESQKNIQESLRCMNDTQQKVFYEIRDWCLKVIWKKKPDPFHAFLTGGAGTGKSHLIRCIFHEATRILSKSTDSPDSTCVLLTAPTGTAAFNIQGMTVHSAFAINKSVKLPYQPLGENLLNTLRSKLEHLKILIIDEVSMVDQKILTYIHGRLSQIKHSKKTFGGISILAVGDFYQLPPVKGLALYKKRDSNFTDLWNGVFSQVELTEIMRQKEDESFAALLNRVRVHHRGTPLLHTDLIALQNASRQEIPNELKHVLHIFPTNAEVKEHNDKMIVHTCNPVYTSLAKDFYTDIVTGRQCQKDDPYVNVMAEDLQTSIQVGVGARIMLTRNIDTEDGLVNGAFGTVKAVNVDTSKQVRDIDVHFDNSKVGKKQKKKRVGNQSQQSLKIKPFQDTLNGKKVTRKQLPMKLAWAATIHKVQGMTVDSIVVSLKKVFQPGMAYVALSRATSITGLNILNFDPDTIYASSDITDALKEMPPFLVPQQSEDSTDNTKIMFHNTEGLLPHLSDIRSNTQYLSSDVICLAETWLSRSMVVPNNLFPDHQFFQCLRSDSYNSNIDALSRLATMERGGVAMFVKKTLDPVGIVIQTSNLEVIAVTVKDVCIVTMYRPPIYPPLLFLHHLTELLREIHSKYKQSVIFGDFNCNTFQDEHNLILETFTKDFGYRQLVNFPTTEAGTCIDLAFVHGQLETNVQLIPKYYSFHDAVELLIENQK